MTLKEMQTDSRVAYKVGEGDRGTSGAHCPTAQQALAHSLPPHATVRARRFLKALLEGGHMKGAPEPIAEEKFMTRNCSAL